MCVCVYVLYYNILVLNPPLKEHLLRLRLLKWEISNFLNKYQFRRFKKNKIS